MQVTPSLPWLKYARADVRIDVVVLRETTKALFEGLDIVDDVIYLPFWSAPRFAFLASFARFITTRRYDATFLAYPAARPEYQVLHALVQSRRRFAHRYSARTTIDAVPGFSVQRVATAPGQSNSERNANLFRAFDARHEVAASYVVPDSWRDDSREPARTVVLHVGSIDHHQFAAKRWPLDNFIALARALVAHGLDVWFLNGPDEREDTTRAHQATTGSRIFEGSLPESARFLSRAAIVVTNDSGIGHLAAGLGRPTISLFGPTPLEYAPLGASAIALRPSPCPPCFDVLHSDMSCKLRIDYACLRRDLPVEYVERVALDTLGASQNYGTRHFPKRKAEDPESHGLEVDI